MQQKMQQKIVTALLLNYKRKDNLLKIIQSLRSQSISVDIFLWNNNNTDYTEYDVDLQINSSKNLMCSPRWLLSCYATTDYVFSLDDDLILADKFVIEDCVRRMESLLSDTIIGYTGVSLNKTKDYWRSIHYRYPNKDIDINVDIIKGRFMFMKRNFVSSINFTQFNKAANYRIEDDIIISSKSNNKILPSYLYYRLIDLPDPYALMNSYEHKKSRQDATNKYFA